MEFGRGSWFRKFALGKGKGRTGKGMGTGKTKIKLSQVAGKGMGTGKMKMKLSTVAGKGMGTGKTKKFSQGELIVRGEYFTCPGIQWRFPRPVRRFF